MLYHLGMIKLALKVILLAVSALLLGACTRSQPLPRPVAYEAIPKLSADLGPGAYELPRSSAKHERPYLLYLPEDYRAEGQFPLLLLLHGGGGSAAQFARNIVIEQDADEFGFIIVFANGSHRFEEGDLLRTWNSGHCCTYAMEQGIDDVAFLSTLIEELLVALPLDPDRVFVAGLSNGAMMANRLAAERSELIAGAASVSGSLGGYAEPGAELFIPPQPANPLRFLAIHGRLDQNVLYAGGHGPNTTGERIDLSVEDQMAFWAAANGCSPVPTGRAEADNLLYYWLYGNCEPGGETQLLSIEDGGHAWPGARENLLPDRPSRLISANQLILEFFSQP